MGTAAATVAWLAMHRCDSHLVLLRVHGWDHRAVGSRAGRAATAAATRLPLSGAPPLDVLQRQALLVAHAARVAQRARALGPAAPLRRLVCATVAAGDAPAWLLPACSGLGSCQGTCRRGGSSQAAAQVAAGFCLHLQCDASDARARRCAGWLHDVVAACDAALMRMLCSILLWHPGIPNDRMMFRCAQQQPGHAAAQPVRTLHKQHYQHPGIT